MYVVAKLLKNFKHLKDVSTFLIILEKKTASYRILKEIGSCSWASLCELV